MKPAFLTLFALTASICHADPERPKVVSYLPEKGLGRLIAERLDITTFRNSLGPRRMPGQRHFADLGLKPVSVSETLVDLSEPDWTYTIRVAERRDVNGDGIEDVVLVWADRSHVGSYAGGSTLLVTRYAPDSDLVALAYTPSVELPAEPEKPSPDSPEGAAISVVSQLYAAHRDGTGPFFQTGDRARLDRVFTPALADLIWKDASQPDGEGGAISADPLIDAHDGEPGRITFSADPPGEGKVLVTASFHILGSPRLIRFRMVQSAGAWKIADILSHNFTSLRETLEEAYAKPAAAPK